MKRKTTFDAVFDFAVTVVCILCLLIVLYPLYFVFIASISGPSAITNGKVILLPRDINWSGYKMVFGDARVLRGYGNTMLYAAGTTVMGLLLTIPCAYALSRSDFVGRKVILKLMVFTMYFSGGMIPTYMVVRDLGLIDNRFTVVLMLSFTVHNLLVARTFFANTLPTELWEAAEIDGCSNGRYFVSVVIPLSGAIIAVIALYYCVAQWNDYMTSLLYLNTQSKYSLQMFLRDILLSSKSIAADTNDPDDVLEAIKAAQTIKYAVVIVAIVPMMIVYPFLQRFFVQGVMIGSIKG
ncbi:MAG: carbohydrate ABC transporter permease [Clostridia bacterium]|nr:carbohydrate ABC transporter permease [Clostridia bacterium]